MERGTPLPPMISRIASTGSTLLASMAQIATAVAAAGATNVINQCDSSQP
jgi:hypothetical protein